LDLVEGELGSARLQLYAIIWLSECMPGMHLFPAALVHRSIPLQHGTLTPGGALAFGGNWVGV
jgi:hypothetical protein